MSCGDSEHASSEGVYCVTCLRGLAGHVSFSCKHFILPGSLVLYPGDRGTDCALVEACLASSQVPASVREECYPFLNELEVMAPEQASHVLRHLAFMEERCFHLASEIAKELNKPFEVLGVECQFDGRKVIVYFRKNVPSDYIEYHDFVRALYVRLGPPGARIWLSDVNRPPTQKSLGSPAPSAEGLHHTPRPAHVATPPPSPSAGKPQAHQKSTCLPTVRTPLRGPHPTNARTETPGICRQPKQHRRPNNSVRRPSGRNTPPAAAAQETHDSPAQPASRPTTTTTAIPLIPAGSESDAFMCGPEAYMCTPARQLASAAGPQSFHSSAHTLSAQLSIWEQSMTYPDCEYGGSANTSIPTPVSYGIADTNQNWGAPTVPPGLDSMQSGFPLINSSDYYAHGAPCYYTAPYVPLSSPYGDCSACDCGCHTPPSQLQQQMAAAQPNTWTHDPYQSPVVATTTTTPESCNAGSMTSARSRVNADVLHAQHLLRQWLQQ